ncbi:hypothetical protein [Mangrovivirga cuniculi]|uniref:VWFA domain-containing protein n=1 Tax=Mangrovivirga cuniculi TaxID=2715131 RepID=A0A4D7JML1_9BACT|nr:hypothetical protein [Mangrovivirga cuniculi]QCK16841.1 hypothetical protein DCC35_19925 [Mangrovivirga cuniculi]
MKKHREIKLQSRRNFLVKLALLSASALAPPVFTGCKKNEIAGLNGKPPFNVWQDMINTLSTSPDNFPARRKSLINKKDIQSMHSFVQKDIALLPSDYRYFRYPARNTRYGEKAAIRCGMATPREKAEILNNMLKESGFESKVVYERVKLSEEEVLNILFRNHQPKFAPEITDDQIENWLEILGADKENGQWDNLASVLEQNEDFTEKILALLDEEEKNNGQELRYTFNNNIPAVVVGVEGKELFLHIFDPSVKYGEYHPTNTDKYYSEAGELFSSDENISIRLTYTNSIDGSKEYDLLNGEWKSSELVGNQVNLMFLKNMGFEKMATSSVNQISSFTPSLTLQDLYEDKKFMEKRSFIGDPITLEGEKLIEENNKKLEISENKKSNESLINKVSSLEVKAIPGTYPKVQLQVFPKDSNGNVIEGLQPGDFNISDNKKEMMAFMKQNKVAPKILVIYDTSLSMPKKYRDEGIKTFVEDTQQAIKDVYPLAKVTLQKTGSTIYTSHYKAALSENDLIIYATDGHNNDKFDPSLQPVYKSGPPTIYLNVYESSNDHFEELATRTHASVIPANDQQETIKKIKEELKNIKVPPYLFTYHSTDPDKEHVAEVSIRKDLKAQDKFKFLPIANELPGKRMVGLYMYLSIGNQKPVRRVLAGWDTEVEFGEIPVKKYANKVHEMLMGNLTLAFEREAPPLSVRLTDYLKALMSNKNWYEKYQDNELETAIEELEKGTFSYPSALLTMMQPLKDSINAESITWPLGFRIGCFKVKPAIYNVKSLITFDYLPTSDYRTLTKSRKNSFTTNLKKTSQLALLENHMFETSTFSLLENKNLEINNKIESKEKFSGENLGNDYYYWKEYVLRGGPSFKVYAADTSSKAYWEIDKRYGGMYGILPDQTGGGGTGPLLQLKELQNLVDEYSKLAGVMNIGMAVAGVGSVPVGIVASYSLTLMKLYAIATEAVILMDSSNLNDQVKKAMAELACNIYKEIHYGSLGHVGAGMSGIENLIAAMGGNYSFTKC